MVLRFVSWWSRKLLESELEGSIINTILPLLPVVAGAECPPRLLLAGVLAGAARLRLVDDLPDTLRDRGPPSSLFCGEEARDADGVLNCDSEPRFCRYLGFFMSWYWNLLLALLRSETGVFGGRPRRFPERADIVVLFGWLASADAVASSLGQVISN